MPRPKAPLLLLFGAGWLALAGCNHSPRSGPLASDSSDGGSTGSVPSVEGAPPRGDRAAGCEGEPDGTCDPPTEGCACSDCVETALCNPDQCTNDGVCDLQDACICVDCHANEFCVDSKSCDGDGVCDSFYEGCRCSDCAAKPECGYSTERVDQPEK
jgi:hypothetical protein